MYILGLQRTYAIYSLNINSTHARSKKIVRYTLFEMEKHVSGNSYDFESGSYNIEHVSPESVNDGWDHFDKGDQEQIQYRIGNLTLKSTENRIIGNSAFEEKREAYRVNLKSRNESPGKIKTDLLKVAMKHKILSPGNLN